MVIERCERMAGTGKGSGGRRAGSGRQYRWLFGPVRGEGWEDGLEQLSPQNDSIIVEGIRLVQIVSPHLPSIHQSEC